MAVQDVINGALGVSLAYELAQVLPPRLGGWFTDRIGGAMARFKRTGLVRAARANQWIVQGGRLSTAQLDQATRAVFQSTARNQYDYYHLINNPQAILNQVEIDPTFQRRIEQSRTGRQGQLLITPHFRNFDLAGRAAALYGLRTQVLSYPQPQAGYRLQNRLRNLDGIEITPISISALRKAANRLENGGTVLTSADRPMSEPSYRPTFFGRPAALPIGYVRLALKANVPVFVFYGQNLPDGRLRVMSSEPITMRPYPDRALEYTRNAEAVLEQIEALIRQAPEQWSMFYPVWPEVLNEIP